jgi:acyl carrier protein
MGLDSVELILEVEKTFGITIADADAEKIRTVSDLQALVRKQLEGKTTTACASSFIFYSLRRVLMQELDLPKTAITPQTALKDIIPRKDRRVWWKKIATATVWAFPALRLREPYATLLSVFALVSIIGTVGFALAMVWFFDDTKWWWLLPVGALLFCWLLYALLRPLRTSFPQKYVRNLCERLLVLNYSTVRNEKGLNQKEVEMVLMQVIADRTGIPVEEILPEHSFTDDLGVD